MNFIISILSIISVIILYNIFDKRGFIAGFIFKLLFQILIYLLNGTLVSFYDNGIVYLIISLVVLLIIQLILTSIEYYAYNKTNSFFGFVILGIVLEFLILFAISFIISFVGISMGKL